MGNKNRFKAITLTIQILSSFILRSFENLLKEHFIITLFLTMLIGAGGNCGNQVAVTVVRGIATGEIKIRKDSLQSSFKTIKDLLVSEITQGIGLAIMVCAVAFARVILFSSNQNILDNTFLKEAIGIVTSLFLIIITSIAIGVLLPIAFLFASLDPGHAVATITVIMDIFGVVIVCTVFEFLV